jgi:hypothetical protein
MFPLRAFLDFEGRRLQGARPFAVWEICDGAWTWQSENHNFPFQSGRGDALSELRNALRLFKTNTLSAPQLAFWVTNWRDRLNPAHLLRPSRTT